jgi:hypothetical protein
LNENQAALFFYIIIDMCIIEANHPVKDIKPRPNHKIYIQTLRKMTPAQRLAKAFELSEFSKQLFTHGLRRRFPDMPEPEFRQTIAETVSQMLQQELL